MHYSLPGHGLSGKELQLIVVQTETGECDKTSEGLSVQVVQRVVTKTKPFDVLQALEGQKVSYSMNVPTTGDISACLLTISSFFRSFVQGVVSVHLKGHVGDVDQLVVCKGEQIEEAELRESSRLDLFHSVAVDHELLQRGQSVKGLLDSQNTKEDKMFTLSHRKHNLKVMMG